jgi:hypothetical protein
MFDWNDANISHIAEHGVDASEAEQVLSSNPLDVSYEVRNGEIRFRQVGETSAGRILAVISTIRDEQTRVITAYPASRSLCATYLEYKELTNGEEDSS